MVKSSNTRLYSSLLITFTFLVICWIVFGLIEVVDLNLRPYGLRPREAKGLLGIVTMHFLHGDLDHITNNTLSFAVLNTFLFFFYREIASKVFWWIFFLGAILLWTWGRESNHIGASLIIFGQASFLFFSGIFRQNETLLRVALVVAFYYGAMVWYVFPVVPRMSWEGHMSGALVGLIFAFLYRGEGPQRRKYQYEIDEEIEAELQRREAERLQNETGPNALPLDWNVTHSTGGFNTHYDYIEKPQKEDGIDQDEDDKA